MASKSKRRSRGRSAVNLIDQAKRNIDRGDYKQALKDVRVCYRENPKSDYRCLLEHAYIGRVQQLVRKGQIEDARRIARDLLDLGITEPAVGAGLPDMLLSVGMFDCLPQGDVALSDTEHKRLRVKAADQAVAHPQNTPQSMPEVREGAERIRAALKAVERGDESVALECLRDISSQSLFADWKYFVRGLIAYYRRDKDGMANNWDRLDADRAAARIVVPLKVIAGMTPPQDDGNLRTKIGCLENHSADRAVLSKLTRLRQSVTDHDWDQLFKTLQTSRQALREMDAGIYQRLISCLCGVFMREGLVEELKKFSRIVDPLPIDPGWNRAMAIACESSDFHDDDPEEYWRKYLQDLKNLPLFSPAQRDLARGLVWLRLAEYYEEDADDLRHCRCGMDHQPQIEEAEEQAEYAFAQCIKLAPHHAPAYLAAALFYKSINQPERTAELYRRLLDRDPDNLSALNALAVYHISRSEGLKAREFALRAHELKPLDRDTGKLLRLTHTEASRELARSGQYDKARAELADADRLQPEYKDDFDVLARKAVLEFKAGNTDAARQFVEQAQETLEKPGALWLVMTIEAIRFGLPWQETHLYEQRWLHALKKQCHGETAGLMCRLLDEHTHTFQPYSGHDEHLQNLLQYIGRCTRVKWRLEDMRLVCEFLERLEELELLAKFAKIGMQKHPQIGYFHWLVGMLEFRKGPFGCNRPLAVAQLKMAIDLASKSDDSRDERIVKNAKQRLDMIEGASHLHDEYDDDDLDNYYDDEVDEYSKDGNGNSIHGVTFDDFQEIVQKVSDTLGLSPEEILNKIMGGKKPKS